jgi:ABC-type transporter Mla maintaining outer membrane lipid asymmetry ATPase subunit MlaF
LFGDDPNQYDEARMAARLRAGFVFAGENLFGELTLAENLALPLLYQGKLAEADVARRVAALLELVELTPQAGALPGGVAAVWRRRAVLARALALQPELLFLDNPDGGLPARHRQWLIRFLDQLWRGHPLFGGQPMTLVVATDELQHWQHPQRQFAGVAGGRFEVLGAWGGEAFRDHPAVKELLTLPEGTGEGGAGPQETVREWPSPADAMTPPPK